MKTYLKLFLLTFLIVYIFGCTPQNSTTPSSGCCSSKFEENWESLAGANVTPNWFLYGEFGIYTHWGPVSNAFVNMEEKEHLAGWHGMQMWEKESSNFKHHVEQYGDPAELPTDYSHCFKITLQGYKELGIGGEDG